MTASLIDRIGNWNPQLLREVRGRLKPQSVMAAIGISLIGQVLLMLSARQLNFHGAIGTVSFWESVFQALSWILPYGFFLSGVYTLISDLTLEEQRGTLNFIRLSPRPSETILLGKLLGVPTLPYLALLLAVPLHLVAAAGAQVSLGWLISFYVSLVASCIFLFSVALLIAFLSGSGGRSALSGQQSVTAIAFAALTLFSFVPLYMFWGTQFLWSHFGSVMGERPDRITEGFQWFYMPLANNVVTIHLFTLANLLLPTYGIWRLLKRRFHTPQATILSKKQSYVAVAYLNVLVLGFLMRTDIASNGDAGYWGGFFLLYGLNFFTFFILMAALSPQRLAVLDWLRYEQRGRAIIQDLVWGEKSPAPVAIAINCLIAGSLLLAWVLLWPLNLVNGGAKLGGFLLVSSFACTILIYSVIAQWILVTRTSRPVSWAVGTILSLLVLPPITLGILQMTPSQAPLIWAFLGMPWFPEMSPVYTVSMVIGLVGQAFVLILLTRLLINQLKKLGTAAIEEHGPEVQ